MTESPLLAGEDRDLSTPFDPPRFGQGGHVQTFLGFFHRRRLTWSLPAEDLVVESEPGVRVLCRASYQPGNREAAPALILIHGMGGCDQSSYMVSTGLHAYGLGYHVIRMNMRGAGDSYQICPRLYHAGIESDLVAVARAIAKTVPRIGLFGASLGANHVLLALGRSREALPHEVLAGVAVSPPLDLIRCTEALHRRENRPYVVYFLERLKDTYVRIQKRSDGFYEAGRQVGVRTVREFDERITAPYAGFASADEYYTRSSSGPWLRDIGRPTLVISAENDPMIPGESVRRFELPAAGVVVREVHPTGGHVGFAARTRAPGRFWAAERALDFLDEHVGRP